ncbi:MAG: hypothetical protein ACP5MT_02225 [Candidatus Acidifodinimicrobium sp.]
MINFSELLAIILALLGVLLVVSTSRFYIALNKDRNLSIARIRLYRYSAALFSFILFLNVIFAAAFVLSVLSPSLDFNLIGILIYALGISFSFIALTRAILKAFK